MTQYERFLDTFFNPAVMAKYFPNIVEGLLVTCQIAVLVVISGILLGLFLALLRSYRWKPINLIIIFFVDMCRSLPPLVLILILYFGLPNVGFTLSGYMVLWLVLTCVLAAFSEEIFWAGILSVDKGQWMASRSTGMSYTQTLLNVVMPQAIRLTIPPLTNRTIAITKNTALGMVIGVDELLNEATTAQAFSGNATPLMMGAIAYLMLFVPVVYLGRYIEHRFAWRKT